MSLIDTVKKFAPLIAETIANPALGAVDAVKMVAESFDADPANQAELASKIEADPQAEYKLKYLDLKLAQENDAAQIQKAQISDTEDAREKLIERKKLGMFDPELVLIICNYLGLFLTLGGIFYLLIIEKSVESAIWAIFGSVITMFCKDLATINTSIFGKN